MTNRDQTRLALHAMEASSQTQTKSASANDTDRQIVGNLLSVEGKDGLQKLASLLVVGEILAAS